MKYTGSDTFHTDYARLAPDEQALFRRAVRQLNAAYARRGSLPLPRWPASLRIKAVRGHSGVWEMTWSFSGPDGRATFEFIEIDGEPAVRWRRVGDHSIFTQP